MNHLHRLPVLMPSQIMVFAEEIKTAILRIADERGPDRTFALADVARAMDEKNWVQIVDQVKFVAGILIDEGKIISRKSVGEMTAEFSKAPQVR